MTTSLTPPRGKTFTRLGEAVVALCMVGLCAYAVISGAQQSQLDITAGTTVSEMTQVLGRPTNNSISVSVLSPNDMECYAEYGTSPGNYTGKTSITSAKARIPVELAIEKLQPNTRYYYRLRSRQGESSSFTTGKEYTFQTQRPPGSTFVFGVQADSHPERLNRMFDPDLYSINMANVRQGRPDFYITLGDDFSIDTLSGMGGLTPQRVAQVYINQRPFLGVDGASTPIFTVNGNHEQAAKYLLNGTTNSPAVWAGKSRNTYYPQPTIGDGKFYTGDMEPVEHIGMLNDYYAWTWGDALFISLDPYWHSDKVVDNELILGTLDAATADATGMAGMEAAATKQKGEGMAAAGGGKGAKDIWDVTHGEAQYRWLEKTLRESKAKYKFIFAHHVLGTGRGGTDMADLGEWGGKNQQGVWEFDKKRPGWDLPIHQLMVKYNVSAFFQGHDHLFVRQVKDGVIYQEVQTPADSNYGDGGNSGSYKTGDHLNAAGHLRVTVSPEVARVDYVRAWMPKDLNEQRKQGEVAFSYEIKPAKTVTATK